MNKRLDIDKLGFVEAVVELHDEIAALAVDKNADPGRIMRLTALATSYSMLGIASLIEDGDSPRQDEISTEEQDEAGLGLTD